MSSRSKFTFEFPFVFSRYALLLPYQKQWTQVILRRSTKRFDLYFRNDFSIVLWTKQERILLVHVIDSCLVNWLTVHHVQKKRNEIVSGLIHCSGNGDVLWVFQYGLWWEVFLVHRNVSPGLGNGGLIPLIINDWDRKRQRMVWTWLIKLFVVFMAERDIKSKIDFSENPKMALTNISNIWYG